MSNARLGVRLSILTARADRREGETDSAALRRRCLKICDCQDGGAEPEDGDQGVEDSVTVRLSPLRSYRWVIRHIFPYEVEHGTFGFIDSGNYSFYFTDRCRFGVVVEPMFLFCGYLLSNRLKFAAEPPT